MTLAIAMTLSYAVSAQEKEKDKTDAAEKALKDTEVPAAVKSAFMAKYPHSNVKKWAKEDGNYEAAFDLNKVETTITLNLGGSILETETDITTANLPKATADYLAKHFAGKK